MSTGRTGTINQALGIALIVFVMLTFILTVTTYLFFGQKLDAERELAEKNKELATAVDKAADEATRSQELTDFIQKGMGEKSVDEIRQEFAGKFPDYKDREAADLTVYDVAEWLDKARLGVNADVKTAEIAKKAAEEARLAAEQDRDAKVDAAADQVAKAEAARKVVEQQANARRLEFEQAEQKLVAEKQKALEQVEAMRLIIDEISKGENAVGKTAFEGKDPGTRVGELIKAVRERDKTIQAIERTELLGAIAAEDPQVQTYVLEALGASGADIQSLKPVLKRVPPKPADSGPIDGRIVSVDPREQLVMIRCDSTFGLRPGLVFNVHSGTLPSGAARPVKAVVEVVEVEERSLVRGRIRRDSISDPILPGDTVSTPLWSAGRSLEAVVVGLVDFNGDGKEDLPPLEDIVRRSGGKIERSVGPATVVLVDAGKPDDRGREGRGSLKPAETNRRNAELAEARRLGVRVLTLDEFLEWLGADRPVVASSVVVPGSERVPPTASPTQPR